MSDAGSGGEGAGLNSDKLDAVENQQIATSPATVEMGLGVDDILLPRSVILRLAKEKLPPGTAIQRDAATALIKAATVFVSYLSSHANDVTEKKTVMPEDVLAALTEVEFDAFRPRLERQMKEYTAMKKSKREDKKSGRKPGIKGQGASAHETGGDGDQPENKRLKRDAQESKDGDERIDGSSGRPDESGIREGSGGEDDDDNEHYDDREDDDETEVMEDMTGSHDEDGESTEDEREEADQDPSQLSIPGRDDDIDMIEEQTGDSRRRKMNNPDAYSSSENDSDDN